MSKLRQLLARPVQQFPTDTTILELGKQSNDLNLAGLTRAEAESNYIAINAADVTGQGA